eukprot:g12757.t1
MTEYNLMKMQEIKEGINLFSWAFFWWWESGRSCVGESSTWQKYRQKWAFYPSKQNNPRFRHDNVMVTDLDMPERQTNEVFDENSAHDPKIEKFLTLAFADEDFESVTTLGGVAGGGGGGMDGGGSSGGNSSGRPGTAGGHFPVARGLVSSRGSMQ